jgi:response regulator RpfG family c-di-GMP phosphodiesterase
VGEALRLSRSQAAQLQTAAACHGLGLFTIPEELLAKPAPLAPEEAALLDRHPQEGADMSRSLGAEERICETVRAHRRRFDELSSRDAVPLEAGILNTIGAFVSMTSDRPYRRARSKDEALAELVRERGRQFDPRVVDAAVAAFI